MKQIIHDFYSGEEVDSLDFEWDAKYIAPDDWKPLKVLSVFFSENKGDWDTLCRAVTDLTLINGEKMSPATFGARINGEWIYMWQIVEGLCLNAARAFEANRK